MSSVNPISSVSNPLATDSSTDTASRVPKQVLGQNDFLKLLAVQFQSQDPMKPMEDTAFIAQMAQFSSLEQSQTLTQQMTQLRASQDIATANSYIGRQVTVDDGTGKAVVKGNVDGVEVSDGVPRLTIGDATYPLSSVLFVAPGTSVPTPSPAASVAG
jgi:flagellar basal-body rod modification protein FlgD